MKTTSYLVCSHFLPAIFNGDESGLSELEVGSLEAWMDHKGFDLTEGHFSHDSEEEADLNTCSVMGTVNDVVTLTWVVLDTQVVQEGLYVDYDEDTALWCVFGETSGRAYSSWASEDGAEADKAQRSGSFQTLSVVDQA